MSDDVEPEAAHLRTALATLVATEPELPAGSADIERRGKRRLAQRRWGAIAGALVVAAAGVTAVSLTSGPDPVRHVAQPPTESEPGNGSQLAEGFPIGSAVNGVAAALPAGVSLGELPMDISWRAGGLLDVPVVTTAGPATLTLRVSDGTCEATVLPIETMTWAELDAIARSVCAEWISNGSPVVIIGPGEENPDAASQ